jgi:hypothetical protein
MKRLDQHLEDRSGELRDRLLRVLDSLHKLRNTSRPSGRHDAELGQMSAQGVHDLGSLPDQEIPGPKHESGGSGLLALGNRKAHGRAPRRLTDRLGISGIVPLALNEGLT